MNPDEIVVHVVDRQRCDVVLDFLRERIGQSCVAAHLHPHGQVLALDVAGANVARIRAADLGFLLASDALSGAIADLGSLARTAPVVLHQDCVIDIGTKGRFDGVKIQLEAVRSQLNAVGHAAREIVNKAFGREPIAGADPVGANQFGIGVDCNPRPEIASVGITLQKFRRDVRLFCGQKRPNLIALNLFAREVYESFVQVIRAGYAKLNKQFGDSVFGNAGHANRRTNRIAFYQCSNHLSLFLGV